MGNEDDPLDGLPDNEHAIVDAILTLLDASDANQDLKDGLIGLILVECEEWAKRMKLN